MKYIQILSKEETLQASNEIKINKTQYVQLQMSFLDHY